MRRREDSTTRPMAHPLLLLLYTHERALFEKDNTYHNSPGQRGSTYIAHTIDMCIRLCHNKISELS